MPLRLKNRAGIWHIHGTIDGRRIRQSTGTRDRALAERIRTEEEARITRAALYGVENEATFADAAVLYLQAGKRKRYLEPLIHALGKRRLATIQPGDLKALALKLYPKQSHSTRNTNVIKPARAVINHAAECGLCRPMTVKMFPEQKVIRQAIDREWIDAFRANCACPYTRAVCLFMWTTAARVGECVQLEPHHFDLERKIAVLPRTKNGHPRVYHLTDEMITELRQLPARRINYGHGPLRVFGFATRQGFEDHWNRAIARAGIVKVTRHEGGRHSFATEMVVRRGVDVVTAARLGGWEDPRVLIERYVHAEHLGDVAERVFGSARNGTELAQPKPQRLQVVGKK